jgi:hypothetical protein
MGRVLEFVRGFVAGGKGGLLRFKMDFNVDLWLEEGCWVQDGFAWGRFARGF